MPTIKQQIAFKKLSDNVSKQGKKPLNIGSALRAAGYSESVCRSPQRVTQTKGWAELFEDNFPNDLVLSKHKALLESDNNRVVASALDMVYKLKGNYKESTRVQVISAYEHITDEELEFEIERLKNELRIVRQ